MGGVASFNRNILKYFDRTLVYVRVILIGVKEDERVQIQEGFNCDNLLQFIYSEFDNYSFVLKKLGVLIGRDSDYVLTDNVITLHALSLLNSKSIVHYLNHDFFYVKQALSFVNDIDYCIAHSQFFNDCLAAADYNSFEKKLIHLPYGVEIPEKLTKSKNKRLKLVFLGRLDYSKGILSLIEIETELKKSCIDVDWLIIGNGPLKEKVYEQWKGKDNVSFQQPNSTAQVYELLQKQDILVFPSLFEGTPVAIFEAIACGCVPIVYDIPGGVREYLQDDFSIKVKANDSQALISSLLMLIGDREMLFRMQNAAIKFAKLHLNQSSLNPKYFDFIFRSTASKSATSKSVIQMGFLDNKIVPNILSRLIKYFRKEAKRVLIKRS